MSKPQLKILLIEDSVEDAQLLERELGRGGYSPYLVRVDTAEGLQEMLQQKSWDIIISDYSMPRFTALTALKLVKESGQDLPFIVVSGNIGEETAVQLMKSGAHDYLMKDNLSRLIPAIERELREAAERCNRRNMAEQIRQGKMEWEAVFDSVSDIIILTDLQGRVKRCNRRVAEYFHTGYPELVGMHIAELFYGPSPPEPNRFSFTGGENPYLAVEDLHFPRLNGWFNVSSYSIHAHATHERGMVHIIKDITKRKRMEEEKRLNDRELLTLYAIAFRLNSIRGADKVIEDLLFQLHNMLEIDFSAIHLLDEKRHLELRASRGLSEEFAEVIGHLNSDEVWVRHVLEGNTHASRHFLKKIPSALVEAGQGMGVMAWCAVPLKTGEETIGLLTVAHRAAKHFSTREIFLLNSIANQLAVLIENHMLYEKMKEKTRELQRSKKELRENLQKVKRANIELERLNDAKNTFIGVASHELKTPLTSIFGGLQFLSNYSNLQLTPEQQNIFSSVCEGVTDLRKLVEDLLSISRIEATGVMIQKKACNFTTICREVYEAFTLPLSRRRISVEIAEDESKVLVDEGFCRLVLRNLLENAIKFTPDGGKISIAGRILGFQEVLGYKPVLKEFYPAFPSNISRCECYYRLDVIDSGVGIPFEERLRIFDKFYGVGDIGYHSSGKTDFMSKGSGLGLSIVRGIMDAHAGAVWTSDGPGGKGSVFSLLFPAE